MSPDRENTLKFVDWTLAVMRQEWIDAKGDKPLELKWFERINRALEMRIDVMKMIAYDHAIAKPVPIPAKEMKAKKKTAPPPKLG